MALHSRIHTLSLIHIVLGYTSDSLSDSFSCTAVKLPLLLEFRLGFETVRCGPQGC
jgi:hypothetical protein